MGVLLWIIRSDCMFSGFLFSSVAQNIFFFSFAIITARADSLLGFHRSISRWVGAEPESGTSFTRWVGKDPELEILIIDGGYECESELGSIFDTLHAASLVYFFWSREAITPVCKSDSDFSVDDPSHLVPVNSTDTPGPFVDLSACALRILSNSADDTDPPLDFCSLWILFTSADDIDPLLDFCSLKILCNSADVTDPLLDLDAFFLKTLSSVPLFF
mmetsp:Transcript_10108/g.15269  ORF Transcript_10108/g.15269 Transcript_10108/m.15269 type:complete len:217 (+) Transcript_10108:663-1313(+)